MTENKTISESMDERNPTSLNQEADLSEKRICPVASTQNGLPPDISRERFLRMNYAERAALKETRPGLFEQLIHY